MGGKILVTVTTANSDLGLNIGDTFDLKHERKEGGIIYHKLIVMQNNVDFLILEDLDTKEEWRYSKSTKGFLRN